MKDELLALVADLDDPARKMNLMREYLQALALRSLHESEAFRHIVFVGGTALRFVHSLARFSEDLDFTLEEPKGYQPEVWLKSLKHELTLAGFDVTLSWNGRPVVQKAWLKFAGLMHETGLSPIKTQNVSIKIEIDTAPPKGGVSETTLINRHRLLALRHYDLPSLMAGKIHALLTRSYPKGRDWYDFVWYHTKRPPVSPNLPLLQNALQQSRGKKKANAQSWKNDVAQRIATIDTQSLIDDVAPFLERPNEKELLTRPNLLSAVEKG